MRTRTTHSFNIEAVTEGILVTASDAGECVKNMLLAFMNPTAMMHILGVWRSRGRGGRGGAKMAVRVLHLRKLAQLLKVHHVQGLKTPQGDCHHPTEHLLQHTGSLIKCDHRQIT